MSDQLSFCLSERLPVRIDSRIRIPEGILPEKIERELRRDFEHANPKFHKQRNMGIRRTKEKPVIRTWTRENGELTLPRGGTGRLREHSPFPLRIADRRFPGDPSVGEIPYHDVALYPFQERCVSEMLQREQGIVRSPTGSGKSTMILAAASRAGCPSLVVVPSTALFEQWIRRAQKELGLRQDQVGVIRGKTRVLRPFTVAVWKTLDNLSDEDFEYLVGSTFGAVFFDEVHRFGSASFYRVGDRCPARYRIGVSDDETRADGTDFLVYDITGEVIDRVDEQQLVDDGFVHEVSVVLVPTASRVDWYRRQLVFQGVLRREGAKEAVSAVRADWPDVSTGELFSEKEAHRNLFGDLVEALSRDDERDRIVLDLAREMLDEDHRVLIYTGRTEHARRLCRRIVEELVEPCGLLVGEEPEEFESTIEALGSGYGRIAVANFQAAGTGVDIPTVDRGICAMPFATRQIWRQVRGRFCRTARGKKDARLYYLWDEHVFGERAKRNMQKWNRVCSMLGEAA